MSESNPSLHAFSPVQEEHLRYLDRLRESGVTNMFGASPYVQKAFGLTKSEARATVVYWMETFGARQAEREGVGVNCDQCQATRINGLFCHERGCPNDGKRFEEGEWVRYFKCRECGCDVRQGEPCGCTDEDDLEFDPNCD